MANGRERTVSYHGVKIVKVFTPRFEVRRADGRKYRTFATLGAAKAFIDGFAKAAELYGPKQGKASS